MLFEISIKHLRNIEEASFKLGKKFNIFYGENGSGKTSILESIYLLATAKSFRSIHSRKIINENNYSLMVFGRICTAEEHFKIGIERDLGSNTIRVNGQSIKSVAELAEYLPVLVIEQDSHKLLEEGPQWRRKFVDWGLFHVKHDFTPVWRSYRKSLKQRNALLIQGAEDHILQSWTVGFSVLGESFSELRERYIEELHPYFETYVEVLLGDSEYTLSYRKGWPKEITLLDCLNQNLHRDRANCRTNYGPHRGDLVIRKDGKDVREHVSRGQQKLLVYALNLAQVSLLKDIKGKDTLLLLDDLGSELDVENSSNLLMLLSEFFGQVCITTANLDTIPIANMDDVKMFHVKHGSIEVINELSINND